MMGPGTQADIKMRATVRANYLPPLEFDTSDTGGGSGSTSWLAKVLQPYVRIDPESRYLPAVEYAPHGEPDPTTWRTTKIVLLLAAVFFGILLLGRFSK